MTADVRTRVRRQWRRYAVAAWLQVVASLGVSLYMFVRFEQARNVLEELTVKGMFVAYAFFVVDYNAAKPHTWLRSAGKFGAAAWVMMWLTWSSVEPLPQVGLALFALGVVCVAAWVLAWRAKATAEEDLSLDELMNADLATRFDARDNKAILEVDDVKVLMACTVRKHRYFDRDTQAWVEWDKREGNRQFVACSLGDIKSLRTIYIRRPRKVPMPRYDRMLLKLTPGPALRFDSPDGEWIFPSNRAYDALEIIKDKRQKFGLGHPSLGPFLPPGAS
jgi:hypothetical protein